MSASRPVHVSVELGPPLHEFQGTPHAAFMERALDSDLTALRGRIGLSGKVNVELFRGETTRPVSVEINGRPVPYPPVAMLRAWLSGAPPDLHPLFLFEEEGEAYPSAWIETHVAEDPNWSLVAGWLERLVYQAALEQPSALAGPDDIARYAAAISADEDEAAELMLPLLDFGVSIADRATIARELADGRRVGRSLDDTLEAAFTELRTHRLEVHLHPATLGELSPGADEWTVRSVYGEAESVPYVRFRNMEETFFSEFGFRLPDIVWVPSPELPERAVAVRIDQFWAPPVPFPPPGLRLVNASADALVDFDAQPAVHPIFGTPCGLIEDRPEWKEELEERAVVTWGPVDFVILNLYGELDRRPHRLLGIEEVEYELARLQDFGFDGVVAAILAHYSLGELTRIFRAALAEGISLRNLPALLERLVEFDVVQVPQEGLTVFDDRLPVAATGNGRDGVGFPAHYRYLRRRLARALTSARVWYGNTLIAYELAPELDERAVSWATNPPSGPEAASFRDEVWRVIRSASRLPFGQVLITSDAARVGARSVLAPELPALTVLSRDEVDPGVEVNVLGTIG